MLRAPTRQPWGGEATERAEFFDNLLFRQRSVPLDSG
jgi:hypothetical protein